MDFKTNFSIILITVLSIFNIEAQINLSNEVIGSDGSSIQNADYKMSFTIGESSIANYNQSYNLSEGFQQGDLQISISIDENTIENEVSIYPNPATDFIRINVDQNYLDTGYIKLFDSSGKMVMTVEESLNFIDISALERGVYIIQILIVKNKVSKIINKNIILL